MDGIPTNCKKVMQELERGRAKKLEVLGPALNQSVTRLMMSLTEVGAKFLPASLSKAPTVSSESRGSHGWMISFGAAELWFDYVIAPGVQRAFEQNPQKTVTEDDPGVLQGENNGVDCGVTVTFKPGTSNSTVALPNGPSTIIYNQSLNFGLGFSVSGWVGGGGIGTIGVNVKTGKKVANPQNPKGRWSLEQWTHSWIGANGKTIADRPTFSDLPVDAAGLKADGDTFSYYDHPGGPPSPDLARFDNYVVKVYSGKTVCEVKFHFIQRGNTIHWGQGLR